MALIQSPGMIGDARRSVDTGPFGQIVSIALAPKDADAADLDIERWTSGTGAIAFRIVFNDPQATETGVIGIIYGWSPNNNDLVAVNAAMATLNTGLDTPASGGTPVPNTSMLPRAALYTPWRWSDGITKIKTIAVRSRGAALASGATLELVT